jgi:hypothetical protein
LALLSALTAAAVANIRQCLITEDMALFYPGLVFTIRHLFLQEEINSLFVFVCTGSAFCSFY